MDEIKAIELYEFFDGEGYDLGNQDGFLQALKIKESSSFTSLKRKGTMLVKLMTSS